MFIEIKQFNKKRNKGKKRHRVLIVNYNKILKNPKNNINKILDFLNLPYDNLQKMIDAVDIKLYSPCKIKS